MNRKLFAYVTCALFVASGVAQAGNISVSVAVNTDQSFSDNKTASDSNSLLRLGIDSTPDYRSAGASAAAAPGIAKAWAAASSSGIHGSGASASASWSNTITFQDEARAGTRGTTTLLIYHEFHLMTYNYVAENTYQNKLARAIYDNHFFAIGGGNTYSSIYSADVWDHARGNIDPRIYMNVTDRNGSRTVLPTGMHKLDIDFIWGQTMHISNQVGVSCGVGYTLADSDTGCVVDAAHSSYWGGIGEVRDAQGNLVTDYSLLSDSGLDFTKSFVPTQEVPEPLSLALMGLGLAAMRTVRRKK